MVMQTLIAEDVLQKRVAELGAQISQEYHDSDNLVLVCILTGAIFFFTDLSRSITLPHRFGYAEASSYHDGLRLSDGEVDVRIPPRLDLKGADVIVVEDIIDTGYTLEKVVEVLKAQCPKSVAICALLDKRERRVVDVPVDYIGFEIPDHFVFGYGVDMDDSYRHLRYIAHETH